VTNAEEARQEKLSRPVFLAIADEAKKQGLPFAGHVPAALTAAEASDAGQKSIEHLTSVDIECSSQAIELREAWDRALLGADGAVYARDATRAQTRALDSLDGKRCQALAERFARNGTWHDPTLVVLRAVAFGNHDSLTKDSRLRYMPSAIRDSWNVSRNELWKGITPDDFAAAQRVFPRFLEVVRILHRAGVKLLAGSDPPVPYCFPGFSLHDELGLFVQAGLTPLEALQAATRNPAEFLGLRDSLTRSNEASSRTSCCSMPTRSPTSPTRGRLPPWWRTAGCSRGSSCSRCWSKWSAPQGLAKRETAAAQRSRERDGLDSAGTRANSGRTRNRAEG